MVVENTRQAPLLSIIIPTHNRHSYLAETLSSVHGQCVKLGYRAAIEVIVSDNASDPPLKEVVERFDGVNYVYWEEAVGIDDSFLRSAKLASGSYVWLFGDDDLISPGAIDVILDTLSSAAADLVYVNRAFCNKEMSRIDVSSEHVGLPYRLYSISEFVSKFETAPSFMGSCILHRSIWAQSWAWSRWEDTCWGYKFLARAYDQAKMVAVIGWVLVYKRENEHSWSNNWPYYYLASIYIINERHGYKFPLIKQFKDVVYIVSVARTLPPGFALGLDAIINNSPAFKNLLFRFIAQSIRLLPKGLVKAALNLWRCI